VCVLEETLILFCFYEGKGNTITKHILHIENPEKGALCVLEEPLTYSFVFTREELLIH
jgi:hypothetical protein